MLERLRKLTKNTLFQWIMIGCGILMIPLIGAMVNFFINKNLIERKIDQSNLFMVKNMQISIDSRLEDVLSVTKELLIDDRFNAYSFSIPDEKTFKKNVNDCFTKLKRLKATNPSIEVMIYLPDRHYILDSYTSNDIQYLYDSLVSQKKIRLSLGEWEYLLYNSAQYDFLLSSQLNYRHHGQECMVYTTPLPQSGNRRAGWVFVSISTQFIQELLNSEVNGGNSLLITDKDGNLLSCYGQPLTSNARIALPENGNKLLFEDGGERFVGNILSSQTADWNYIICTPEKIYMEELLKNRNLNLLILFLVAVAGGIAVIIFHSKNYQPIRQLVQLLPERDEIEAGELAIVEKNLRKLFEEKRFAQNALEGRREHDRELNLLSALKGRKSLSPAEQNELLKDQSPDKHFCLVIVDLEEQQTEKTKNKLIDFELMVFLVNNVIHDMINEEFSYMKTLDERRLVYLFSLENTMSQEAWIRVCTEKFIWVSDFFRNRLGTDLPIIIGNQFDSLEELEIFYSELLDANEQRYYSQPEGVIHMDQIQKFDFSSIEKLEHNIRRFENAVVNADYEAGAQLGRHLFEELEQPGMPFNYSLYYVMAIVNRILILSGDLLQNKGVSQDELSEILGKLRQAETLSAMRDCFFRFLKTICHTIDQEQQDSCQLSERIKTYVMEHYMDCNVNISTIAEKMNITPRYMSKIFKDQTGMNLLNYINDIRIEHAKVLLRSTKKTVDEISEETGFSNTRTFRRNFQKSTGITASNYKNGTAF